MNPDRTTVLRTLRLDAVTVEVVRQFRRHGIEAILLKGRGIADRLYGGDATRTYRDVDLLVAPEHYAHAGRLLSDLGFADLLAGARRHEHAYCDHAGTWIRRADRAVVDLHYTISGARADPAVVWSALSGHLRPLRIGAEPVPVLDDAGLALHVALHAAQHGAHEPKPLADLDRAVATFPPAVFDAAATLATRLDAVPAFVAGLRLVPAARDLADAHGRGVTIPAATAAQALTDQRGTGTIALVLAQSGWRRPLAAARLAFPSRAVLRLAMPLARRGRIGLAAAYAVRPWWMLLGLPAAVRAWRYANGTWRS